MTGEQAYRIVMAMPHPWPSCDEFLPEYSMTFGDLLALSGEWAGM
jgi:hypothetical protein